MTLPVHEESPPLRTDNEGIVRVGGTRVTLESVVTLFDQGAGAEEIALRFDALTLAEIYGVLAFYLRHSTEVRGYVEAQRAASEAQRQAFADPAAESRLQVRAAQLRERANAAAAG